MSCSVDLRLCIDESLKAVRIEQIHVSRIARLSLRRRSCESLHSDGIDASGKLRIRTRGACRRLVALLALRGRGMDCGFHGRIRDWTMKEVLEDGIRNI